VSAARGVPHSHVHIAPVTEVTITGGCIYARLMALGRIVAIGGGGFSTEGDASPLDDYVLALTGKDQPRVCFLGTATGDADGYALKFFNAFAARRCKPSRLSLFSPGAIPPADVVAEQDVLYVGGGSTVNLLALWRAHGLGGAMRHAWEHGAVLCGPSAGAMCWFECGITDSFGVGELRPLLDGLGLLRGSFCPHFDTEAERRPSYLRMIAGGTLSDGYACDDSAALHFEGTELVEVVASKPEASAYRVERTPTGAACTALDVRLLCGE